MTTEDTLPRLTKEIDFKTVKEEWLTIELEDGTIIKFKSVLLRVFETDKVDPITGERIYYVEGQNIVVARAPDKLKGKPSEHIPPIQELVKKGNPVEVKVKKIYEDGWNEYELENGDRLRVKPVITKVLKIKGFYDKHGDPIYIVQSQLVVTTASSTAHGGEGV
ncbi:MAG: hypothetical protein J7J91_12255 [Deltaproteobacteria bacterium]|nr:hypothetical protein [Deltaproteobacteria bacterium]